MEIDLTNIHDFVRHIFFLCYKYGDLRNVEAVCNNNQVGLLEIYTSGKYAQK